MISGEYAPSHGQLLGSRPASLHSDNNEGERPRKRVRKGTKSCWECKRRKVKCQLSSEDVPVCSGCLARGTSCLSQEFPEERDTSSGLQVGERLGRVERLLETLVAKISAYEEEETAQNNILTPESMVLSPHPSGEVHPATEGSPYLSLFDNSVIGHRPQVATPATTTGTRTPSSRPSCRMSKTERVRQALVQLLPSQADTDLICAASHLAILLNTMAGTSAEVISNNFSPFNIAEISKEKPAIIARTLMYIVVSLQQLDPAFDHGQLHILPSLEIRTERILATVNALVTSDDELVTSMEGLECLILQGMFSINAGSPRRAWLIFRRALSLGQLMGLQKKTASSVFPNARNMWHRMVQGDRYLALLLGLPAGSFEDKYEPDENFQNPDINKDELFQRKLSEISLRIIERNQSETAPAYAGTQEIDDLLERLGKEMPDSWWEIPTHISEEVSKEASTQFDRLMSQIWYFQLQGLVHLPFMLRAASERRYDYSKHSCLKACREVMWRYLAMRRSHNKSFCCKVVDFGALTATVALFLGLLDPSQGAENSHQRDSDRALINGVLQTMERFASHSNETIASQSVSVIKSLLAIDQQSGENGGNLRLTIPYFGTISIVRPTKKAAAQVGDPNLSVYPSPQSITIGQHESPQQWPGLSVPNHNPVSFPTVSFTSSHFNPMVPEQPAVADFGWEESDTLFFDSLLNTDIEGNWMFQ